MDLISKTLHYVGKNYKDASIEILAKIKNYDDKANKAESITATLYDKSGKEIAKSNVIGKDLVPKEEEQLIESLAEDHPAVKIAKENLNKVREQVRKAEEQLQATLILSKEHDQTTS